MLTVLLSIVVAVLSWTATHEAIFEEWRNYCKANCHCTPLLKRKFYYVWTCEYCFSHWVAALVLVGTNHRLGYSDWRGLIVSEFVLVGLANVLMSGYFLIRVAIRHLGRSPS